MAGRDLRTDMNRTFTMMPTKGQTFFADHLPVHKRTDGSGRRILAEPRSAEHRRPSTTR